MLQAGVVASERRKESRVWRRAVREVFSSSLEAMEEREDAEEDEDEEEDEDTERERRWLVYLPSWWCREGD